MRLRQSSDGTGAWGKRLPCWPGARRTTDAREWHPCPPQAALHGHDRFDAGADNLFTRNFTPTVPNQVWTSDITYLWTDEGWLYLAIVLDLFNREVVG